MQTLEGENRRRSLWIAGLLLLAAGFLFLPAASVLQYRAATAFLTANLAFFLSGSLLTPWILRGGAGSELPPFTKIWIGQSFGMALVFLASQLNKAFMELGGPSLSLPALAYLCLGGGLLVFLARKEGKLAALRECLRFPGPFLVYPVAAAAVMGPVLAVFSEHLAAFGLDIHQHLFWTLDIVDRGFIPFNERFTSLVSGYPKSFHWLSALWAAFGMDGNMTAIFVKVMPCWQALLFCLVLAELVSLKFQARFQGQRALYFWFGLLGAFLVFFAFFMVPMPYPIWDLLGTPRFGSTLLALSPLLCFYLGYFLKNPRLLTWSAAAFPISCILCLTSNPVLLVGQLTIVFPLLLLNLATFGRRLLPSPRLFIKPFAVAAAFSLLYFSQDPWAISKVEFLKAALKNSLGYSYISASVVPSSPGPPPLCNAPACLFSEAVGTLGSTAKSTVKSFPHWFQREAEKLSAWAEAPRRVKNLFTSFLPFRDLFFLPYAAPLFFMLPIAALLLLSWKNFRNYPRLIGKLLTAYGILWGGVYLGGFLTIWAQNLADRLLAWEARYLIVPYLNLAGAYFGPGIVWLLLLVPAAYGFYQHCKVNRIASLAFPSARWLGHALAVVPILAMGCFAHWGIEIRKDMRHSGWANPVSLAELEAVEEFNSLSLQGNTAIPAFHAKIGQENWLLPDASVASILPFLKQPLLFHLKLGRSMRYSLEDHEREFCSRDAEARDRFIRKALLRYLLLRDRENPQADLWATTRLCGGLTLEEFRVKRAPIFSREGIQLYEFERR